MKLQGAATGFFHSISNRAKQTQRAYRSAIRLFVEHHGRDFDCAGLTHLHFSAFVANVLQKEYAKSTINIYAVCLRAFLDYLLREDIVAMPYNDVLKVHSTLANALSKRERKLRKEVLTSDVAAIIKAAHESPLPEPFKSRNAAIIWALASTGCRISEIAKLRVGDLDKEKREAKVSAKGSERVVFFSPQAVNWCSLYWIARGNRSKQTPAFARHDDGAGKKALKPITTQAIRNVVNSLVSAAGVKNFTPHSFRHHFATLMLRNTRLEDVQDLLGHADPATTRVYTPASRERMRKAHRETWR